LVASITTTESPFNVEQLDLLLAMRNYQQMLDSNGIPFEEATSNAANPTNYDSPEIVRFIARGPFTNWADKSRLDAEDAFRKEQGDNANLNGLFWTVEKKTYENPAASSAADET